MIKSTFKWNILPLLCILLLSGGLWAIRIRVSGSWAEYIDEADLQGPPGSDLISSYESASDQIEIDIRQTRSNWSVDVRKVDTNWHSGLHLYVKRTSDGSGAPGGSISSGTSYQEVTDTYQAFFSGYRQRSYINIQLRVDGVSIQIPPGTYDTTVYYTVYEW